MVDEVVLGVDVGGTHLRLGLVGRSGEVESFRQQGSRESLGPHGLSGLLRVVEEYLRLELGGRRLGGVGIGLPSTVDADRRRVISTPNLPGLSDVDVATAFSALGVPVLIDRDVNMLLRQDLRELGLQRARGIVLGCYLGTGLGCGLSVDGRILVGAHGVAGELAHIPFPGVTGFCKCGNVGCADVVASGRALRADLASRFPEVAISEVFAVCGDEPFVRDWIVFTGATIASAVNILDPSVIVIGGGVSQMDSFPRAALEAAVYRMTRKPVPAECLEFRYSASGQSTGVAGAAICVAEAIGDR